MCFRPLLNSLPKQLCFEYGYNQISGIPKTLCQRSRGSRGKDWTHIRSGYLGGKEKADILTTQKISLQ